MRKYFGWKAIILRMVPFINFSTVIRVIIFFRTEEAMRIKWPLTKSDHKAFIKSIEFGMVLWFLLRLLIPATYIFEKSNKLLKSKCGIKNHNLRKNLKPKHVIYKAVHVLSLFVSLPMPHSLKYSSIELCLCAYTTIIHNQWNFNFLSIYIIRWSSKPFIN